MGDLDETRFSVATSDEARAIAHLRDHGFAPVRIERDGDGRLALVFVPMPDATLGALAAALPLDFAAKIGIAGGPPFR